jgi:hypothetical protein
LAVDSSKENPLDGLLQSPTEVKNARVLKDLIRTLFSRV